jgi:hypothetical protein
MNARKPAVVREPAVAPDHDFANLITSKHDQAISERQRLEGQRKTRQEYYSRERARMDATEAQEIMSLDTQIGMQTNIIDMSLAALNVGKDELSEGIRLVVGR